MTIKSWRLLVVIGKYVSESVCVWENKREKKLKKGKLKTALQRKKKWEEKSSHSLKVFHFQKIKRKQRNEMKFIVFGKRKRLCDEKIENSPDIAFHPFSWYFFLLTRFKPRQYLSFKMIFKNRSKQEGKVYWTESKIDIICGQNFFMLFS